VKLEDPEEQLLNNEAENIKRIEMIEKEMDVQEEEK